MEIEKHPLEPFLPAKAKLLMLGSFRHKKNVGQWIFIIRTSIMICGASSGFYSSMTRIIF